MSYLDIQRFFATHVVELAAVRRGEPKKGEIRAFLCTNNFGLLNGIAGKTALRFRAPTKRNVLYANGRTPESHQLITVWDIFMQDWRNINLRQYQVMDAMPLKTREDIVDFWAYFTYVLKPMTSNEKTAFMDNRGYRKYSIESIRRFMDEKRAEEDALMQQQQEQQLEPGPQETPEIPGIEG